MSIQYIIDENVLTPPRLNYAKLVRLVTGLSASAAINTALVLEYRGGLPHGALLAPVALPGLWPIVRSPLRRYRARDFRMGTDRLRVVRGRIFNSDTVVPCGRVQHINVLQGTLERAFDLSTLAAWPTAQGAAGQSLVWRGRSLRRTKPGR